LWHDQLGAQSVYLGLGHGLFTSDKMRLVWQFGQ